MRLYTFTNYYLSSLQIGLQSAHVTAELFVNYPTIAESCNIHVNMNILFDWAKNHKTMVYLNGGNQDGLKDIASLFSENDNTYPWSYFFEDEASLNECLTCVGIVLANTIYDNAVFLRDPKITRGYAKDYTTLNFNEYRKRMVIEKSSVPIILTDFDLQIIDVLNSCQLAK